ncbi:MAG: hypothetical protein ACI9LX_000992 [Paraglaciecola sp.]|jgi:hypothetical protein
MKKRIALSIPLSIVSMAFFALNANAKLGSTDKVKYAGDLGYKKFCEAVVKDDVNMLKRSVRDKVGLVANSSQAVLKKLIASNGMECNGVDLVSFSEQRKASQVYQYLSNAK